jgi:hypothetical protein
VKYTLIINLFEDINMDIFSMYLIEFIKNKSLINATCPYFGAEGPLVIFRNTKLQWYWATGFLSTK